MVEAGKVTLPKDNTENEKVWTDKEENWLVNQELLEALEEVEGHGGPPDDIVSLPYHGDTDLAQSGFLLPPLLGIPPHDGKNDEESMDQAIDDLAKTSKKRLWWP
eukprot:CAMPEP_0168769224 /NCGR_PEP_ID=MMETSP0725-20121227/2289_1 /TAXON_ID=265536 /ORGANISM="Amphiprora sp., Strain CCMP467" /LENGTH=104 /DNA_ID=CAMNT_0008818621 /DNA_START=258 /DNA_END=569 /DNA_ORIENTATION=+